MVKLRAKLLRYVTVELEGPTIEIEAADEEAAWDRFWECAPRVPDSQFQKLSDVDLSDVESELEVHHEYTCEELP